MTRNLVDVFANTQGESSIGQWSSKSLPFTEDLATSYKGIMTLRRMTWTNETGIDLTNDLLYPDVYDLHLQITGPK